MNLFEKIYSVGSLSKNHKIIGELPDTKTVYKNAIDMAWPSAMESVLVGLVSSIDTMMVGSLGAPAIAAVGISGQPRLILLAVIMSLNVGVTAISARRKGERDRVGANKSLRQALLICFVLAALLATTGFVFARPMLLFAGAQEDVIDLSVTYFRIVAVSLFFTSIGLTINAAQRGCGNTKISMRTNIVANIVNLIFNFLLINGHFGFPRLEIRGAAIATLLGNVVAFLMSVRSISKPSGFLHLDFRASWKLDKTTVKTLFSISSSSFVEQICMRIGFLITTKLVAALGTVAFATHQICMNIVTITFSFGDGLGIGASALAGQNLGAKRPDLASIYSNALQRIAVSIGFVLFAIFIMFRHVLIDLFTNDLTIIQMGGIIMIFIACISPIQTVAVVISGTLRGAGDTRFVAYSSLISIGIVRPLTTYLFCYTLNFGIYGAWMAFMTDQVVRLLINSWRFRTGKWTKIAI